MTTSATEPCEASGRGCGTATGWRGGGRCTRCRIAHNAETNKYRDRRILPLQKRDKVLAALRRGVDYREAAKLAGIGPATLTRLGKRDPELGAALIGRRSHDDQPGDAERIIGEIPASQKARQAAYLAALMRCDGSPSRASVSAGISESHASQWRKDPLFAAADDAVRALAGGRPVRPQRDYRRFTPGASEAYLEQRRRGCGHMEACEKTGITHSTIVGWRKRHPEFAAAIEEIAPVRSRNRRRKAVDEDALRRLWLESPSVAQIANQLGVSAIVVRKRAQELGLPPRKGSGQPKTR